MTQQKTFKRRVRARMAKTGERYTAARRILIAEPPPSFEPPMSVEKVVSATGRSWDAWFGLLDEWGAAGRGHTAMARWLREEHGVASWWSQSITVAYEQARGLRAPGETTTGFTANASRTIAVPVDVLYDAFMRSAGGSLHVRTATAPKSARFDWEDGSTRVNVGFEAAGESKSRVALSHERLPDAGAAGEMKAFWRERLSGLKAQLEGGEAR
jgi:uncharacterized protein DUF4287